MINISKASSDGYPYPPIRETINGKDISIVGVVHEPGFFDQYRLFFKGVVSQHDVIVFEGGAGIDFWQYSGVYAQAGAIAYSQKKRVYQFDPSNWAVGLLDTGQCAFGLWLIISAISSTTNKVSRRAFLKKSIAGMGGASLVLGSYPGILLRGLISTQGLIGYGIDDLLTYGKTDFKNIMVAHGIDRLCHEVYDFDSLVSLHGYTHYETIDGYLMNRDLRIKRLAYLPYEAIGEMGIREYVPDEIGWVLARRF